MSKNVDLSVVIPLFNEEEVLPFLLRELFSVCRDLNKNYEIIFVDDGSTDKTFELIGNASKNNPAIKVLRFSRNFGHQAALNAGIDFAAGDMVVTMDGDLQYPPSLIKEFIKYAEGEGYNIVIGERITNAQNSFLRELIGRVTYKILSVITNLEFRNTADFALYDKNVVSVLKNMPEKERFLRGMVQWVGFRKKYVPYNGSKRKAGKSKYNFRKLAGLVTSGATSFSAFPLRLAFWLGSGIFIFSVVFSGYVVWNHYVNPNPLITGWATLVVLVLWFGSIQLMVLGVVGEYLYKMFNEVKRRPLYIVSETRNIDKENIEGTPHGVNLF